jgi:ATP-dependent Clp protease ATP-binding subunit ClpC
MDDEALDFELEFDESRQEPVISTEPIVVTTYSSHARDVLQSAETSAATAPAGTMTCEHLLLSLVTDQECAAARVLLSCGLDAARIGQTIAFVQGAQPPSEPAAAVILSPRIERVLINASREASIQKRDQIDTLHLLVALLRERQGIAVLALEAPGVGHELVGAAISQAMRSGMTDPS